MRQKNLNSIEKLMDGYNPHRQLLEQTRALVNKWEPTGLLEGLAEETKVHGMAVPTMTSLWKSMQMPFPK